VLFGRLADDDVGEACNQGRRHNQGHGPELDAGQALDAVGKPRGESVRQIAEEAGLRREEVFVDVEAAALPAR
jgi:hypothetical protein